MQTATDTTEMESGHRVPTEHAEEQAPKTLDDVQTLKEAVEHEHIKEPSTDIEDAEKHSQFDHGTESLDGDDLKKQRVDLSDGEKKADEKQDDTASKVEDEGFIEKKNQELQQNVQDQHTQGKPKGSEPTEHEDCSVSELDKQPKEECCGDTSAACENEEIYEICNADEGSENNTDRTPFCEPTADKTDLERKEAQCSLGNDQPVANTEGKHTPVEEHYQHGEQRADSETGHLEEGALKNPNTEQITENFSPGIETGRSSSCPVEHPITESPESKAGRPQSGKEPTEHSEPPDDKPVDGALKDCENGPEGSCRPTSHFQSSETESSEAETPRDAKENDETLSGSLDTANRTTILHSHSQPSMQDENTATKSNESEKPCKPLHKELPQAAADNVESNFGGSAPEAGADTFAPTPERHRHKESCSSSPETEFPRKRSSTRNKRRRKRKKRPLRSRDRDICGDGSTPESTYSSDLSSTEDETFPDTNSRAAAYFDDTHISIPTQHNENRTTEECHTFKQIAKKEGRDLSQSPDQRHQVENDETSPDDSEEPSDCLADSTASKEPVEGETDQYKLNDNDDSTQIHKGESQITVPGKEQQHQGRKHAAKEGPPRVHRDDHDAASREVVQGLADEKTEALATGRVSTLDPTQIREEDTQNISPENEACRQDQLHVATSPQAEDLLQATPGTDTAQPEAEQIYRQPDPQTLAYHHLQDHFVHARRQSMRFINRPGTPLNTEDFLNQREHPGAEVLPRQSQTLEIPPVQRVGPPVEVLPRSSHTRGEPPPRPPDREIASAVRLRQSPRSGINRSSHAVLEAEPTCHVPVAYAGNDQSVVDLTDGSVGMHHAEDAPPRRGLPQEIVRVHDIRILQHREQGNPEFVYFRSTEANLRNILATIFRWRGRPAEADVCVSCRLRSPDTILLNCHCIVCHTCARYADTCPVRSCGREMLSYMRI